MLILSENQLLIFENIQELEKLYNLSDKNPEDTKTYELIKTVKSSYQGDLTLLYFKKKFKYYHIATIIDDLNNGEKYTNLRNLNTPDEYINIRLETQNKQLVNKLISPFPTILKNNVKENFKYFFDNIVWKLQRIYTTTEKPLYLSKISKYKDVFELEKYTENFYHNLDYQKQLKLVLNLNGVKVISETDENILVVLTNTNDIKQLTNKLTALCYKYDNQEGTDNIYNYSNYALRTSHEHKESFFVLIAKEYIGDNSVITFWFDGNEIHNIFNRADRSVKVDQVFEFVDINVLKKYVYTYKDLIEHSDNFDKLLNDKKYTFQAFVLQQFLDDLDVHNYSANELHQVASHYLNTEGKKYITYPLYKKTKNALINFCEIQKFNFRTPVQIISFFDYFFNLKENDDKRILKCFN